MYNIVDDYDRLITDEVKKLLQMKKKARKRHETSSTGI